MVTVVSGLASYPIDTIRRRMMMTSGTGVHYKSSIDCGMQILKNEGFMSMMKGAGKFQITFYLTTYSRRRLSLWSQTFFDLVADQFLFGRRPLLIWSQTNFDLIV